MTCFLRINDSTVISTDAIASVVSNSPQNISDEDLAKIAAESTDPRTGKIDTVKMHENISKHKSVASYVVTLVNGQKFTADWKEIPKSLGEVKQ